MGRPTSPGSRFSSFSACGVKRRMRQSPLSIRMGILTLPIRLVRSSLSCANSKLRFPSCSLTVTSSSLVDCSSSFAVSSSSLVDCSSSLLERASSLADFSSSLMASCSWIIDWRDSLVACKSRRRRASSCDWRLPAGRRLAPCFRTGRHTRRRFLEQYQKETLAQIALDRNHLQGDVPEMAVALDSNAFLANGDLLFSCVVQGRAQFHG